MITKETRKSQLYIFNLENKKKNCTLCRWFFFSFLYIFPLISSNSRREMTCCAVVCTAAYVASRMQPRVKFFSVFRGYMIFFNDDAND